MAHKQLSNPSVSIIVGHFCDRTLLYCYDNLIEAKGETSDKDSKTDEVLYLFIQLILVKWLLNLISNELNKRLSFHW